ncbi:hypothetical protein F5B20DRAFT_158609 [Whalleya microplaca]|nr:hypothetical protein F5B20DRAFT_158609 [Whalleya microplaca]
MASLINSQFSNNHISDTGLTILFAPDSSAVANIVMVHGLQGHPFKTWAKLSKDHLSNYPPRYSIAYNAARLLEKVPSLFRQRSSMMHLSNHNTQNTEYNIYEANAETVDLVERFMASDGEVYFWPQDDLPDCCPGACIITWGYNTYVTKGFQRASNRISLYQYGKNLLYDLKRLSPTSLIIFIAYSLGGIVVKEMLSASAYSNDPALKNIVESTAAIIFLATPHRGSPWSTLGESARKIASAMGMDTNPAILDSLGLKNSDLQRSQDSFSSIWNRYNFQVKTFQEGTDWKATRLGRLNNKVVDDISFCLGDDRENAETLSANHMEICRFSNPNDPDSQKVHRELFSIFNSALTCSVNEVRDDAHRTYVNEG